MRTCPRCKTEPIATRAPYCRPCRRAYDASRRPPKPTMAERFWAKVRKEDHEREPGLGPCWIWTGSVNRKSGYGMFKTGGRLSGTGHRAPTQAHIVACRLAGKTVAEGQEWDHLCRTRACVRPAHLEAVTHRVNVLRGPGLPADYADRTRCAYGHDLTVPDAYYIRPDGRGRSCQQCHLERGRGRRGDSRIHYREANQAKRRAEEALQQVPF